MNNTDKLLRAFIEASGFDIEEGEVTAGNLIDNRKSSAVYSTKEIKKLYPNKHVCTESFGGNWIVSEPNVDYKVTKREVFDYKRHDEKISKLILKWWDDEQYEECRSGRNKYEEDIDFVKLAKEIINE